MKKIIGLTGGIASGKSTVSAELRARGAVIVDADVISRTLLDREGAAYEQVAAAFPQYVLEDGTIDRRGLGAYVFSHEEGIRRLNAITHPIIVEEVKKRAYAEEGNVIIDAPLLIEVGLDQICHEIWLVTADRQVRVERIMRRNGLSREEAEDRINNQLSEEEKRKRSHLVIDNSGSMEELQEQIRGLKERLGL